MTRLNDMKEKATLFKRIIAQLSDLSLLCFVLLLNTFFVGYLGVYHPYDTISDLLLALMFFLFNNSYMQGYHGFTFGKYIMRIKTVNAYGEPIGVFNSFIRELNKLYAPLTLFIGFFYALSNTNRQAWHDKTVSSFVVNRDNEEVFLMELMRKPKHLYVRYYAEFDQHNFAFLNELYSVNDKIRCYKVYTNPDGTVAKFGYFVDGKLMSYTKIYYEDYSTRMYEFQSDGTFMNGRKYLFDRNGNIADRVHVSKEDYNSIKSA